MAGKRRGRLGINSLGELEVEVMDVVWAKGTATVKDVFEVLYQKRQLAYTTIMTVMNRLAAKNVLDQDKATIPYRYKALIPRENAATSMVGEVVDRVLGGSGAAVVSYLVEEGKVKDSELKELKDLIRKAETK